MKEVVATLSAVIRHITSNCVEGFGFLWLEELEKIAQVIGGNFRTSFCPKEANFPKLLWLKSARHAWLIETVGNGAIFS